jgi:peptide/nickel transport system ATP-binding protein
LRAVDTVGFEIRAGETVALVGESGSGKSTIGNAILGLVPLTSGSITFKGHEIASPGGIDRPVIRRHIQVVFQDPYGSLNPARTIGQILADSLIVHRKMSTSEMNEEIAQMLGRVGLPRDAASRYPGNFSGGQRQRIAIARAVIITPELVICDEPVSALDLSVQAQVLNLLSDMQQHLGLAYLFISHDIAVVRHIAHEVVVLYRGCVVERGSVAQVCDSPRHPYTRALFLAAPVPDPAVQRARGVARRRWAKEEEDVRWDGKGCPFYSRCPFGVDRCVVERPELRTTASGSLAACHLQEELPELEVGSLWS